ncbi:hypothetical protein SDJN02_03708, partial [Cucurbita argyrosperma subsp. argyrosperma]
SVHLYAPVYHRAPSSLFVALYLNSTCGKRTSLHEPVRYLAAKDPTSIIDFCLRFSQPLPRTNTADLYGTRAISIELIGRNAGPVTRRYIEALTEKNKKKKKNPSVPEFVLEAATEPIDRELYSDVRVTVRDAADENYRIVAAMKEVNVKCEFGIGCQATTCEDGFKEMDGGVSPLTSRNDDAFELTAIALCILNMRP